MSKLDQITWADFLDIVEENDIINADDCWDLKKLNEILLNYYEKERPEIIKILLENGDLLDNQTEILYKFFGYCENLTNIVIPESVVTIDKLAFYNCSNLTNIIIPESVTSIGYAAFSECSNLTSIIIPESVTSIGKYAFWGCENLVIYCKYDVNNKPTGWDKYWKTGTKKVYWKNQWKYINGVPTPIRKK